MPPQLEEKLLDGKNPLTFNSSYFYGVNKKNHSS